MAPFIGKHNAGGVGDYQWPEDDAVIEVPSHFAAELLQLAPDDFFVVEAPAEDAEPAKPAPRGRAKKEEAPAPAAASDDEGDDSEKGDAEEE